MTTLLYCLAFAIFGTVVARPGFRMLRRSFTATTNDGPMTAAKADLDRGIGAIFVGAAVAALCCMVAILYGQTLTFMVIPSVLLAAGLGRQILLELITVLTARPKSAMPVVTPILVAETRLPNRYSTAIYN